MLGIPKIIAILILFIGISGASGCGSIVSRVAGEPYRYYYGAQMDAENINPTEKPLSVILMFDLPFSFVVDTLFLPVDFVMGPYCGVLDAIPSEYKAERCR